MGPNPTQLMPLYAETPENITQLLKTETKTEIK